jgi:1-deoxy-D-xylulose-5-phosphate reductoisomerase
MVRQLAILGSTGSIGTQALEVVSVHRDLFEVYALTANHNAELLIEQAHKYMPDTVVIANEEKYPEVKEALEDLPVKVWAGADAIAQVVTAGPIDMVLTAMVGYSGLRPTIEALKAHKAIALANKETLVVAGELITNLAKEKQVPIIPVDSEHSAIFQCLNGEWHNPIEKILLTASGGPFFKKTKEELTVVTKEQALKHPNWNMGAKVTIDSASLMNKGFEMIEAKWLFDVKPEQIEIVIHPQSIIHSMVQFEDGGIIAQLGIPDMKLPISYAFSYPERLKSPSERLDFFSCQSLTFEKPDMENFRNLAFAFEAVQKGGNMPCILNAANEVAVAAFLQGRTGFLQMSDIIEQTMEKASFIANPAYDDYVRTDTEARSMAKELINKNKITN